MNDSTRNRTENAARRARQIAGPTVWGVVFLLLGSLLAVACVNVMMTPDESSLSYFRVVVGYFIWHPERIWAVAWAFGVLAAAAFLAKCRWPQVQWIPMLIAYLIWLLFGFLEHEAVACVAAIRVDVLFIWPLIFSGTAVLVGIFLCGLIHAVFSTCREAVSNRGRVKHSLGYELLRLESPSAEHMPKTTDERI